MSDNKPPMNDNDIPVLQDVVSPGHQTLDETAIETVLEDPADITVLDTHAETLSDETMAVEPSEDHDATDVEAPNAADDEHPLDGYDLTINTQEDDFNGELDLSIIADRDQADNLTLESWSHLTTADEMPEDKGCFEEEDEAPVPDYKAELSAWKDEDDNEGTLDETASDYATAPPSYRVSLKNDPTFISETYDTEATPDEEEEESLHEAVERIVEKHSQAMRDELIALIKGKKSP